MLNHRLLSECTHAITELCQLSLFIPSYAEPGVNGKRMPGEMGCLASHSSEPCETCEEPRQTEMSHDN